MMPYFTYLLQTIIRNSLQNSLIITTSLSRSNTINDRGSFIQPFIELKKTTQTLSAQICIFLKIYSGRFIRFGKSLKRGSKALKIMARANDRVQTARSGKNGIQFNRFFCCASDSVQCRE